MRRIVGIGALSVVLFSTAATAGIGKGNGEIGFDLGYTDFDSNVTDAGGSRFNFRGGYHFTRYFELEGQLGISGAHDDLAGLDVDTLLGTIMVNGVANFDPTKEIVPYALAGLGRATLWRDIGPLSTDDSSSASQIAGGVRFFFGTRKRSAFRLEISRLKEKTFDETSTHRMAVFGFTWALGAGH